MIDEICSRGRVLEECLAFTLVFVLVRSVLPLPGLEQAVLPGLELAGKTGPDLADKVLDNPLETFR